MRNRQQLEKILLHHALISDTQRKNISRRELSESLAELKERLVNFARMVTLILRILSDKSAKK